MSMQRALLDIHFMMLLKDLTHQNILELGKICGLKFPRKIRYLVKRSRIQPVYFKPYTITTLHLSNTSKQHSTHGVPAHLCVTVPMECFHTLAPYKIAGALTSDVYYQSITAQIEFQFFIKSL